jgi:predicted PurR-regulated permease PerM
MGQWAVPFAIALLLAYTFHSPLKLITDRLHISNTLSAGIIVLFLISIVSLFAIFLIPLFKNVIIVLAQKLPKLLQTLPDSVNNIFLGGMKILGIEWIIDIGEILKRYLIEITIDWPSHMLNFINTGITLVYIVMFLFMTPIITFYLLKDWPKIEASFSRILQKIATKFVVDIFQEINLKLASYIRGQLLACCVLSALYTVGLFFIGGDKCLVCGIFSGALSIAPFFGPFIGLLATIAVSFDGFGDVYQYLLTIGLYLVIPFVDSNFITPKLIGKTTGIQPVWLLFSICVTVSILGTVGIFVSVPISVILSTVCKEVMKKI